MTFTKRAGGHVLAIKFDTPEKPDVPVPIPEVPVLVKLKAELEDQTIKDYGA